MNHNFYWKHTENHASAKMFRYNVWIFSLIHIICMTLRENYCSLIRLALDIRSYSYKWSLGCISYYMSILASCTLDFNNEWSIQLSFPFLMSPTTIFIGTRFFQTLTITFYILISFHFTWIRKFTVLVTYVKPFQFRTINEGSYLTSTWVKAHDISPSLSSPWKEIGKGLQCLMYYEGQTFDLYNDFWKVTFSNFNLYCTEIIFSW